MLILCNICVLTLLNFILVPLKSMIDTLQLDENLFKTEFLTSASFIATTDKHVTCGWGKCRKLQEPDEYPGPYFYFPDFFLQDTHPWRHYEHSLEVSCEKLLRVLNKLMIPKYSQSINWKVPSQAVFTATIDDLKLRFQKRELIKAVPYLFSSSLNPMSSQQRLQSLCGALEGVLSGSLYGYGFWEESIGMLGATPEVLFHASGEGLRQLKTVACAGTVSIEDLTDEFLTNPKESFEHLVVIDGIVDSLKNLNAVVEIGKTVVLPLKRLCHLVTPIQADFANEQSFGEIVKALHPTPALGAIPYQSAGKEWLKGYQHSVPRQRFGAPAGMYFPSQKKACCLVAIRNVQWNEEKMSVGAGCGIVPKSDANNEWQEMQLKLSATKELLKL